MGVLGVGRVTVELLPKIDAHAARAERGAAGGAQMPPDAAHSDAQVARQLAAIDVHDHKFVLLLYHRPRGHEDAAAAGVDLMISGHTHAGQIVPFNLIVNRVFEQAAGLFRHEDSHLYVSTGTGTWGPVMRLGTRSEITLFEITPGQR